MMRQFDPFWGESLVLGKAAGEAELFWLFLLQVERGNQVSYKLISYLKGTSAEEEGASSESAVFKEVVVEIDKSVLQILIGNYVH